MLCLSVNRGSAQNDRACDPTDVVKVCQHKQKHATGGNKCGAKNVFWVTATSTGQQEQKQHNNKNNKHDHNRTDTHNINGSNDKGSIHPVCLLACIPTTSQSASQSDVHNDLSSMAERETRRQHFNGPFIRGCHCARIGANVWQSW